MFVTRLLSGIVLVLIALLVNHVGGPLLLLTMLGISLIGMFELYRAVKIVDKGTNSLTTAAYIGAVLWYAAVWLGQVFPGKFDHLYVVFLTAGLILILFVYVFTYPKYHADQAMAAFFGIVYVAVCLSFIYQTRELPDGRWHVWLILLCSWGCDTSAYCVGRLFGKHKMAPVLSPKKSVEGAIGGLAGAALLGGIYGFCIRGKVADDFNVAAVYAIICAAGALISMVGDLAASAIKRNHEIKDYGHLIPGHGGILDRFDSVIITAPIIYFLCCVLKF